MKLGLKHICDLNVGDRCIFRKSINTQFSSNIQEFTINKIEIVVIKLDHEYLSAHIGTYYPPSEIITYKINDMLQLEGFELIEIILDD